MLKLLGYLEILTPKASGVEVLSTSTHVNVKTNNVNYCHTFVQREKYASMIDPLKASDSFSQFLWWIRRCLNVVGRIRAQEHFFDMMFSKEFNFTSDTSTNDKRASPFTFSKCGAIFIIVQPHLRLNSKISYYASWRLVMEWKMWVF